MSHIITKRGDTNTASNDEICVLSKNLTLRQIIERHSITAAKEGPIIGCTDSLS